MERVLAAVDAGVAALSIMTAPDMPKEVFIEDVIERVVMMTKQQLQNTIFPEFDPVYKVNPRNKGTCDRYDISLLHENSRTVKYFVGP